MSTPGAQLHIAAVVLHDGGGFASPQWDTHGRALNLAAGLEWQTRQPDSIITLGAGSYAGPQDLSRSLRSRLLEDRRAAKKTLTTGPGGVNVTSLWRGLERQLGDGFSAKYQWLWILPADAVPEPEALEHLEERLFTVKDEDTHQDVEVVGAKQWIAGIEEPRLLNAGLWTARSGEVVTLTEPKEFDQGQYDGRDEVPAVSAHGMLVRASLFGDLGGFSPALEPDYAAAEFCARAREVGARTVLEPTAAVRRVEPAQREMVHRLAGALLLPEDHRRSQIRTRLTQAPWPAVVPLWVLMWVAALLRTVALFACKAPDAGLAQLRHAAAGLSNIAAIAHLRRHRREGRAAALSRSQRAGDSAKETLAAGRRAVRENLLSGSQLREQRRRDTTAETVGMPGERAADEAGELPDLGSRDGEFDQMPVRRSEDRLGLFLLLVALTGVSLVGFRQLLTAPALAGGASLPVSGSVAEVWQHTVSFLVTDSLGERAAADPFNLVLLILSALSFGHASAVLLWVVVLAAPLSALTAWWAAGLWSPKTFHRLIAALIWALLPALHSAAGQGRIGAVIAHILLPVLVLTTVRAVRAHGRHQVTAGRVAALRLTAGWETAAGAALLLAVVTAAAPVLLVPAVLSCVIAALVLRRAGKVLWLLPIPALAIFAPMLISALDRGANLAAVLVSEPGRSLSVTEAGASAPLWQQLLGFSQAFDPTGGLPGTTNSESAAWLPSVLAESFWALRVALLTGAPLLVIAVLALLAVGRRAVVLSCGLIGLGTLGYSALVSRLAAGSAGSEVVGTHIGPLVSVLALCLIAAAVSGLSSSQAAGSALGGVFSPVASTLLVLAVFTAGVFWAAPRMMPGAGLDGMTISTVNTERVLIQPGTVRTLPATAADLGTGPAAARTLVLSSSAQGVSAEIRARHGSTLDSRRTAAVAQDLPLWATPEAPASWLGMTGPGTDPLPAEELSASQQRLGELVAGVVAPGSEHVSDLAAELGIGYVLVTQGTALREAADTAGGLISVGDTEFGSLWRVDTAEEELPAAGGISGTTTAWARIVTAEGDPVALLPSSHHRIDLDLSQLRDRSGEPLQLEPGTDYYVELATERAVGWDAELDGQSLRRVTPTSLQIEPEEMDWTRQFHLPESFAEQPQGQLTLSHSSQLQYPILFLTGLLVLIFLLVAVPLPRSWRILPVIPDQQLTQATEVRR
ncbi:hypothetical protein [Nesterenkonia alkaliphila]|uniref:Glycosyltransferase n=1 Tax=Nesterenkonia alkaliphila TaxID=1463631 RepID=A0A7K1UEA5_9MICC|nr:hypothetical protein [Nesterenkonia alkaliphila]MVT24813.1 hypothetical protein [Nesterenkonia alkaliphila]GFZ93522.1 hypothetical protein GCM10011359_23700 [Nesterenkonia alkaliphila]